MDFFAFLLSYITPCWDFNEIIDSITKIPEKIVEAINGLFSGANGQILKMADWLWQGSTSILNGVKEYIPINHPRYSGLATMSGSIYNIIAAIGIGLCILFWFIGIIDKMTKEQLSVYTLIKCIIEILIAMIIIGYGFEGFKALGGFGDKITEIIGNTLVSNNFKFPDTVPSAFLYGMDRNKDVLNGGIGGLLIALMSLVFLLLYMLFSVVIGAVAITVCISRAIQLYIYIAFIPLGISQLFNKGGFMDSSGMSYIKKIIAVSLQGPIMLIILNASQALTTTIDFNSTGLIPLLLLIAVNLVTVSLFLKSQQIANDIMS